jgi:hypothetical protein
MAKIVKYPLCKSQTPDSEVPGSSCCWSTCAEGSEYCVEHQIENKDVDTKTSSGVES